MNEKEQTAAPSAELHTADGVHMSIALNVKSQSGVEAANLNPEHVLTFSEVGYNPEKFTAVAELVAGVILRSPDMPDYPSPVRGRITPRGKGAKGKPTMTMKANPVTMIIGDKTKINAGPQSKESAAGLQGALIFCAATGVSFEDYQTALRMVLEQANNLLKVFGQDQLPELTT